LEYSGTPGCNADGPLLVEITEHCTGSPKSYIHIFSWGFGTGLLLASLIFLYRDTVPTLFSADATVRQDIQAMLPFVALSMPFASVAFTLDGVLYGARDFKFAARTMFLASGVAITSMLIGTLTDSPTDDIQFIWSGLIGLMITRIILILTRLRDPNGPFGDMRLL